MSHTTTIDAVEIKDLNALRAAINELKSNGVECDLLENAVPRAYYSNQQGMNTPADLVLKLHDSRYDVGLYKQDNGAYQPRCDLWGGDIARNLGVQEKGVDTAQNALGKLFNTYSIHAVTRKAVQQGYRVQRVAKENGAVQLRIAV